MRGASGVKMNWPVVAIAFAVIGVPMGVAVIQDLGSDTDEDDLLARIGEVNDITADEDEGDEPDLEEADDIAGRWHEPAMDQAFFDEVFLGGPDETKPALRGPLAGLDWHQAPAHPLELGRWPRARAELHSNLPPLLDAVVVSFPDDGTAERIFTNRWGDPLVVIGQDQVKRKIWLDPGARLRLVLEQEDGAAHVTLNPYIPAQDLVTENGQFAFESYPLLGATPEVLAAKYGAAFWLHRTSDGDMHKLSVPGIESGPLHVRGVSVDLFIDHGKVASVWVVVSHELDADGGPNVFASLSRNLGRAVHQSSTEHRNTWRFANGIIIEQEVGHWRIALERRTR